MRKSKFPFRLWHWTTSEESLYDLSKEELSIFAQLVAHAFKTTGSAHG